MLHSGNANPTCIGKHYEIVNGRVHTRSGINVAWQLNDVGPTMAICRSAGQSQIVLPLPHSVRTCNERAPIRHIPMRRGLFSSFWEGRSVTGRTAGRLSHRGGQRSSRTGTTVGALLHGLLANCELLAGTQCRALSTLLTHLHRRQLALLFLAPRAQRAYNEGNRGCFDKAV